MTGASVAITKGTNTITLSFFDMDHYAPRARHSDPETSHQAAASIGDGVVKAVRAAFTIKDWAADELCDYLGDGVYAPTVKSALARLHTGGWLKDSGERRLSHRGREQVVWTRA